MLQCFGGPLDGLEINPATVWAAGNVTLGLRFRSYDMDPETRKLYWTRDPDPEPIATVIYRRDGGKLRHVRTRL
jgi:hypothetical protein